MTRLTLFSHFISLHLIRRLAIMAELKDLTNIEALNNQVERLGDMIELNADYLQDLKHQIKSLPDSNFDDLLKRVDEAQHLMYKASQKLTNLP